MADAVPEAATVVDLPGIGKGAALVVGMAMETEVLATLVADVTTGVVATGPAAEVDLAKLAGRVMPLAAAHCSGVSSWRWGV